MAMRLQIRRGTAEEWLLADPVLAQGEIGLESGGDGLYRAMKVGDGLLPWSSLPYFSLGGGGAGSLQLQDNGVDLVGLVTKLNFEGFGVSQVGSVATVANARVFDGASPDLAYSAGTDSKIDGGLLSV
jgi:hypothetical protein